MTSWYLKYGLYVKGFLAPGPYMTFLKPVTVLHTLPGGHVWDC